MNNLFRNVPPRAGSMLEALRGLGYSTASALADIIDNSISAGSSEIRVSFSWAGSGSRVCVVDNGRGMDDAALEAAMRLGAKSPLDVRDPGDLGRFGMGLKTASFSQCRRLTVASVVNGTRCCLRWDLDEMAANLDGGWHLYEGPAEGSQPWLDVLSHHSSGTLVLWEVLDRIVTAGYTADDFNELIDRVEAHLGMTFHRLLQGPRAPIRILLNGRAIVPWDPFMSGHAAKPWDSPMERRRTPDGLVSIECHVLPHRDKLTTEAFERAAGPEGWNSQQGFYVYRNERLLVAGGWLGLGQGRAWNREESYRLARIRLDIPNTADTAWKIDIRKSTARPPVALRPWLTGLAEDTRRRARQVFAHRGAYAPRAGRAPIEYAWKVEDRRDGVRYRVDQAHPAVAAVLDAMPEHASLLRAMLKIIEETVPVQRIWLDTAEKKDISRTGFAGEPTEAVISVLNTLYADMTGRRGMSPEAARQTLLRTEPFNNFADLIGFLSSGSDRKRPT